MTDKTTIPHIACNTPNACRREQVCLEPWRCSYDFEPATMVEPESNDDWVISSQAARITGQRAALAGGPRTVPIKMLHSVAHCFLVAYDQAAARVAAAAASVRKEEDT